MKLLASAVVLLSACGGGGVTGFSGPACPPNQFCGPQPTEHPQESSRAYVYPLKREQTVTGKAELAGIEIAAAPAGAAAWKIQIANKTDAVITAVWDESTFVLSDGRSAGRLIRGETRKIDIGKAQPASPIAPQATMLEIVFAEQLVDSEELESKVGDGQWMDKGIARAIEHAREVRNGALVGGKLVLTVQGPNGKQTWTGDVVASEAK
jgi:hypothetical protein